MIFYYLFVYVTVYLIRTEIKINIEISQYSHMRLSAISNCNYSAITDISVSLSGRISPNSLRRTRIIFRK